MDSVEKGYGEFSGDQRETKVLGFKAPKIDIKRDVDVESAFSDGSFY